ncbi:hypothetical protein A5707_21460 [Mycobacterium kyorinense]|uniref:ESX-1 secretion-associated protein n=1 Tax=Mycobacterium kyorinense TaxID=487514 RepID=A0A1A2Z752_9MYCO|nr:type VII secretion target [Mycobacterium kyorinense]OBI46399.1 hypothetical protein A5707_21460 [Mycobacterium kyorinense]
MSGGQDLAVDADALGKVGSTFTEAGGELAALQADAPLGDAAGVGSQLATAAACRKAQSAIAAQTAALAKETDEYGGKLKTAAAEYRNTDRTAGEAIHKVKLGK